MWCPATGIALRYAADGARAAYALITRRSRQCSGNAFLCEDMLAAGGAADFDRDGYRPGAEPQADLFVDHA